MKIKPIAFSFAVSLIISFIFLLVTFWIFYKYSWSAEAAKDALSTTGSYFGAASTLVAAIVAAHLFNDWRTQYSQEKLDKNLEKITEICQEITNFFLYDFSLEMSDLKEKNKEELSKFLTIASDKEISLINRKIDAQMQEVMKKLTVFSTVIHHAYQQILTTNPLNKNLKGDIFSVVTKINSLRIELIEYNNEIKIISYSKKWSEYATNQRFEKTWDSLDEINRITEIVGLTSNLPSELIQQNLQSEKIPG